MGRELSSSESKDLLLKNEAKKEESTAIISQRGCSLTNNRKEVLRGSCHLTCYSCIPILDDTIRMGYSMHLKNAPTILGILLSGFSVTLHSTVPDMAISVSFRLNSRWKYYSWMICQVLSLILAALFSESLKRRVPDVILVYLMGNWMGKKQNAASLVVIFNCFWKPTI